MTQRTREQMEADAGILEDGISLLVQLQLYGHTHLKDGTEIAPELAKAREALAIVRERLDADGV